MNCTDSIMNSKLLCLLEFVIVSQLTNPSPFTLHLWGGSVTVDFVFTIMLQSKENNHHFPLFHKNYSHS